VAVWGGAIGCTEHHEAAWQPGADPAELAEEAAACVTVLDGPDGRHLAAVGLETGRIRPIVEVDLPLFDLDSLGIGPGKAWTCTRQLREIDLATGEDAVVGPSCTGVTDWGAGLVASSGGLRAWGDPADLVAGLRGEDWGDAPHASRVGRGNGWLIFSWHADHQLQLLDPADGTRRTLALAGFDSWIWGLSGVDGDWWVVDDGRNGWRRGPALLRGFGPEGDPIARWALPAGTAAHGLACGSGAELATWLRP
jgi:hypothetical protein